jgi:N-methylhydantoinase A
MSGGTPDVKRSQAYLGIDTGGTFTDLVLMTRDGTIIVKKVDNLSSKYERNILRATLDILGEAGVSAGDVAQVVHCTTLLGNAVVQRQGPKTGLLTTMGFRDVLELRRQRNPVLYDVFWEKPAPLVPRRLCREVTERIGVDGSIVAPLDLTEARQELTKLVRGGVSTVAVCFINACVNPVHERMIATLVAQEFPSLDVSISSEVSPEWSEYERTSTTVTNAFVKPILRNYLQSLRLDFREHGIACPLDVMQSAGGIMSAEAAIERAVLCLESGPAAAVMATCTLGRHLGIREAVTLEMGGTTAKSTLIEKGVAHRVMETEIGAPVSVGGQSLKGAGYALRIPAIDTAEVGAGGGSIAQVDAEGSLSVGPEGAGADPGPACYDRGGTRATITDANVVLGYLRESHPLGGDIRVDGSKAEAVIAKQVARPLGLSVPEAAYAVRTLANATMARAIRAVSTERGRDVRKFVLFAAGGGGPGHAAEVARLLGIRTVVVPPVPGLFSALGMLWSPLEYHFSRAANVPLKEPRAGERLESLYRELEDKSAGDASPVSSIAKGLRFKRYADLHYVGQFHEITIPVRGALTSAEAMPKLRRGFEREHHKMYGYRSSEEAVEVTSVRVVAYKRSDPQALRAAPDALEHLMERLYRPLGGSETWPIRFGPPFGELDVPVLSRGDLGDTPTVGPIILPEYDTTVVVPPDFQATKVPNGSVILKMM